MYRAVDSLTNCKSLSLDLSILNRRLLLSSEVSLEAFLFLLELGLAAVDAVVVVGADVVGVGLATVETAMVAVVLRPVWLAVVVIPELLAVVGVLKIEVSLV